MNKENKEPGEQQLIKVKESINAFKTGKIDALVIVDDKQLKIFTEKTADKTYRILIEKMHEGAVMLSEDGTILYCNSAFAKMVNLPLQVATGSKLNTFINHPAIISFEAMLKRGRQNSVSEEVYIYANGGKVIPVIMSVNALTVDNNFFLSIILTDLTIQNKIKEELKTKTLELEQKNAELDTANKDLMAFTYVSSHDLQEPLRKIQTYANIIIEQEEKNLSETGKGYFLRMTKGAKRMQDLIQDLLIYSGTKSSERKFESANLNLIFDGVINDFEDIIEEKKATIQIKALGNANIIPFQFRQLVYNLISNSLKFSNPAVAPQITVKSKIIQGNKSVNKNLMAGKNYFHLTINDNGIGFDPQYKERIFEVFQRLNPVEIYRGTGMGLAICKRIVENHNGIITANSKLNEGARFDIYLPAE